MHQLFTAFLILALTSCGIETDQFGVDTKVSSRRSSSDGAVLSEEARAVVVLYVSAVESDGLALTGTRASEKQAQVFRKSLRKRVAKDCGSSEVELKKIFKCVINGAIPSSEDAGLDISMGLITDFNTLPDGYVEFTLEERQEMMVASLKAAGFGQDQIDSFMANYMAKMADSFSDSLPEMLNHVATELEIPLDKLLQAIPDNLPSGKSPEFHKNVMAGTLELMKEKKFSAKKSAKLFDAFRKVPEVQQSDVEISALLATISEYVAAKEAERPSFLQTSSEDGSLTDRLSKLVENLVAGVIGGSGKGTSPVLEYATDTLNFAVGTAVKIDPIEGNFRKGNDATIVKCEASPALPAGLLLDPVTCVISGIPAAPLAAKEIKITATNSLGEIATDTVTLTVAGSSPAIAYPTTSLSLMVGVAMIDQVPTLTAGIGAEVLRCAVSPDLPDGLLFDEDICGISGTSTAAASSSHIVTVTNSHGMTATAVLDLIVEANTPTVEFTEETVTIVQNVAMTPLTPATKTNGLGANAATCTMTNIPGLSIDDTTCVITGTPTTAATAVSVTVTHTNSLSETDTDIFDLIVASVPDLNYTETSLSLVQGTAMTAVTPATQEDGDSAVHDTCAMSPAVAGLDVNDETCAITGTPTTAMTATLVTLTHTNSFGQTDTDVITFTVASVPTLEFTETSLALVQNQAMTPVSPSTQEDGDAASHATCSLSPAVAGLDADDETCQITGTPTTAMTSTTITITHTNSFGQTDTDTIDIEVQSAPSLNYTETSLSLVVGSAMTPVTPSTQQDGDGATHDTCVMSPALAGLSVNDETCVISGTPTSATDEVTVTLTHTNSFGQTDTDTIDITVASVPSLNYTETTLSLVEGTAMTDVTPATKDDGDEASWQTCEMSPAVGGLAIDDQTCVISGTPTTGMVATLVTITHTNDFGQTDTDTITIDVAGLPSLDFTETSLSLALNSAMTNVTPATKTNGTGASDGTCVMSPVISGLSVANDTCVISGTPDTAATSVTVTFTHTNSVGQTDTDTIDIEIVSTPTLNFTETSLTVVQGVAMSSVTPATKTNGDAASSNTCEMSPAVSGLSIDDDTCVISGTPDTAATSVTITFTHTNSFGQTDTDTIDITVASLPNLVFAETSLVLVEDTAMTAITPSTHTNGDAATHTSCTMDAVPGLSINNTTCEISGTPTTGAALTSITVTATNSFGQTETHDIDVTVQGIPVIDYANASLTLNASAAMTAENPTAGTFTAGANASVSSVTVSPSLPNGLNLHSTSGVISGTPTGTSANATYTFTITNNHGHQDTDTIDIEVQNSSTPTLAYNSASISGIVGTAITTEEPGSTGTLDAGAGATITDCTISPPLPNGLSIDSSDCSIYGIATELHGNTTHTVTITNSFSNTDTDTIDIYIDGSSPSLAYGSASISAVVGVAITDEQPLSTGTFDPGDEATISGCAIDQALPQGLYFDTDYCDIYGLPEETLGNTTFTVTLTNSFGKTAQDTIDIFVDGSSPSLAYGSASISTVVGVAITDEQPLSTGTFDPGDYATITDCQIDQALPNGLSFDTTYCDIYGMPTETLSSTTFTVTLTNSFGKTAQDTIDIFVDGSSPSLAYASATISATVGVAITDEQPLSTGTYDAGEYATITDCQIDQVLPNGLSFDTTYCDIYGMPTETLSSTTFTVTLTNSFGKTAQDTIDIFVDGSSPSLAYNSATISATVGVAITDEQPLSTGTYDAGEYATITDCQIDQVLPNGLSFDTTYCDIYGTPTETLSSTTFTVTLTNSFGKTAQDTIDIVVDGSSPSLAYASAAINATVGVAITDEQPLSTGTYDAGEYATITDCQIDQVLPNGLSFDTTYCDIYGTPTETLSSTTFTVTLTNSFGKTAQDTIDIVVDGSSPSLAYASATISATVGTAITDEQPSSTGTYDAGEYATITGCAIDQPLPNGLTFDTDYCDIYGTPTESLSLTTFTVTLTNSFGKTAQDTIDIEVVAASGELADFDFTTPGDFNCSGLGSCATYTDHVTISAGSASANTLDLKTDTAAEWNDSGATLTGVTTSSDTLTLSATSNSAGTWDESWTPQWDKMIIGYSFEGSGTTLVNDRNPGTYNGTFYGNGTQTSSDAMGGSGSATLDGDGDYIDTGYTFDMTSNTDGFTVMTWFKIDSSNNTYSYLFGSEDGDKFQHRIDSSSNVAFNYWTPTDANGISTASSSFTIVHDTWHHAAVTVTESGGGGTARVYVDGYEYISKSFNGFDSWDTGRTMFIGALNVAGSPYSNTYLDGEIDEVGIWTTALTGEEIRQIYQKQNIAISGNYTSEIFDIGGSSTPETLAFSTPLPFGKSLSTSTESTTVYSDMENSSGTSTLQDGLLAYFNFDGDTSSGLEDVTGNYDGTISGTLYSGQPGVIGNSWKFGSGQTDHGDIALGGAVTVSVWLLMDNVDNAHTEIVGEGNDGEWSVHLENTSDNVRLSGDFGSGWSWPGATVGIYENQWVHLVVMRDASLSGDQYRIYRNGVEALSSSWYGGATITDNAGSHDLHVGGWSDGTRRYSGLMDELGIWNRGLSPDEVIELYRRGSNQVEVSVRTCSDATCSTNPDWVGSGGFLMGISEWHNNSAITSGDPSGTVNTTAPFFRFSDFVSQPSADRYWQYQVNLTSVKSDTVCSSAQCKPVIDNVSLHERVGDVVGGAEESKYSAGYFVNATAVSYSSLTDVAITDSGAVTYQASPDGGTTWYYHNGSAWAAAASTANANASNDTAWDDMSGFPAGTGNLVIKAIMGGTGAGSVTSIVVNGSN